MSRADSSGPSVLDLKVALSECEKIGPDIISCAWSFNTKKKNKDYRGKI